MRAKKIWMKILAPDNSVSSILESNECKRRNVQSSRHLSGSLPHLMGE